MSIITRMLRQTAVYWPPREAGLDGRQAYYEPRQIDCRWVDKAENFVTATGNTGTSNAVVFVPDEEGVEVAGVLWLGLLRDLEDADNPLANELAYPVQKRNRIPNLRATETLVKVML